MADLYLENIQGLPLVDCPDDVLPGVIGIYPGFSGRDRSDAYLVCRIVGRRGKDYLTIEHNGRRRVIRRRSFKLLVTRLGTAELFARVSDCLEGMGWAVDN